MVLSLPFREAARDYLYLLEKNYPQKAIIKIIGDRYSLTGTERTLLYRGLTTSNNKTRRAGLLWNVANIKQEELHIDGYNVLITIGSYLNGNLVFIANDNFLRDASEIHGKVFRTSLFDRSISLLLEYLKHIEIKTIHFYLDQPVSKSGELANKIHSLMQKAGFKGSSSTVASPDYMLKNLDDGIVCTSDSTIIDHTQRGLFDLARHTISHHFDPDFLDLYIEF